MSSGSRSTRNIPLDFGKILANFNRPGFILTYIAPLIYI